MLRRFIFRGRITRVLIVALSMLALHGAAPASVASAQTQDEITQARSLAKDGFAAYKANDFKKALALFEQARKLYPSAQILRMSGYSHLALEDWEKAADLMDAAVVSTLGPLDNDDKKDAIENLAKATVHLGFVKVTTDVVGAELTVDDRPPTRLPLDKPIRVLAGKHKITVRAADHTDATAEISVEGNGKTAEATLSPKLIPKQIETCAPAPPPPPPPAPPPPPKGWVPMQFQLGIAAGGLGALVGAAAIAAGVGSLHLQDQVKNDTKLHYEKYGNNCDNQSLTRDCAFDRAVINYDADRANTLANVSLGAGIAGGVLLAGGVALILFAPEGPLGPKPKPLPPKDASSPQPPRKAATSGFSAACAPMLTGGVACAGNF